MPLLFSPVKYSVKTVEYSAVPFQGSDHDATREDTDNFTAPQPTIHKNEDTAPLLWPPFIVVAFAHFGQTGQLLMEARSNLFSAKDKG